MCHCVMIHNWSARKQRLHLQTVARISRHSVLWEDSTVPFWELCCYCCLKRQCNYSPQVLPAPTLVSKEVLGYFRSGGILQIGCCSGCRTSIGQSTAFSIKVYVWGRCKGVLNSESVIGEAAIAYVSRHCLAWHIKLSIWNEQSVQP